MPGHALRALAKIDDHYRARYGMSMVENQKMMHERHGGIPKKPNGKVSLPKLWRRGVGA